MREKRECLSIMMCIGLMIVILGGIIYSPAPVQQVNVIVSENEIDRIDVNVANQQLLETLPTVGEATAKIIIARRPFANNTELRNVIGEGKYKAIKNSICIGE